MKFGEKTNQWLADQKMQDSELRKKLQEIQAMQRQLEKQEQQEGNGNGNEQLQADLSQAMAGLDSQIQQTLQNNSHSFSEQMAQAATRNETSESRPEIIDGRHWFGER